MRQRWVLSRIACQHVVDSGGGKRRMPHPDAELMQVADDVSGSEKCAHGGLLMVVNLEGPGVRGQRANRASEIGADGAAERGVKHVDLLRLPVRTGNNDGIECATIRLVGEAKID